MRQRVDELGVSEPIIQLSGDNRLVVELAGIDDPEKAVEIIGKTAKLEFVTLEGEVIVTGDMLKEAKAIINDKGRPEINIEFDSEGAKLFGEATSKLVSLYPSNDENRVIAIVLDGEVLTVPHVNSAILTGTASISGGFEEFEDAADLASLLRAGALPVSTQIVEKRTVGPTLGSDSLESSKNAIIVGFILLALFMLVVYRLPGLMADVTLIVFGLLLLSGLVAVGAVLTLPGLAGILLTVAMAADANIIIFERIKDEIRNGKSLRASVESGFRRAFWTIFDSNLTTIIGAAVLFQFGTGSIRGFALTLTLGIIANMITALLLTRAVLRLVVKIPLLQNIAFYGVSKKGVEAID
jgi:preprotein translocase subunit SecD